MYLSPTRTVPMPTDPMGLLGHSLTARPPTMRRSVTGTVRDVQGYVVLLETDSAMLIAVDIEDCIAPRALVMAASA